MCGTIPLSKDPTKTDEHIITKYELLISKFTRWRRRQKGKASVQYLRYRHFFVIVATAGEHKFFEAEGHIKDVRREPLKFGGYSIGLGLGDKSGRLHVSVRIEKWWFRYLLRHFTHIALRGGVEDLECALKNLPFEPYAPVQRQILSILNRVNSRRRLAGLSRIDPRAVYRRRSPVRPFE